MEGNVSGYVCNHGSPNGERDTASPRLWAMLRTQASDEEADDVFSRRHLYCGMPVVTSWAVAGQQVVFLHMYLQTRVTLRAFPVATPRGRSVFCVTIRNLRRFAPFYLCTKKIAKFVPSGVQWLVTGAVPLSTRCTLSRGYASLPLHYVPLKRKCVPLLTKLYLIYSQKKVQICTI